MHLVAPQYIALSSGRPEEDELCGVILVDHEYPRDVSIAVLDKMLEEMAVRVPKARYHGRITQLVAQNPADFAPPRTTTGTGVGVGVGVGVGTGVGTEMETDGRARPDITEEAFDPSTVMGWGTGCMPRLGDADLFDPVQAEFDRRQAEGHRLGVDDPILVAALEFPSAQEYLSRYQDVDLARTLAQNQMESRTTGGRANGVATSGKMPDKKRSFMGLRRGRGRSGSTTTTHTNTSTSTSLNATTNTNAKPSLTATGATLMEHPHHHHHQQQQHRSPLHAFQHKTSTDPASRPSLTDSRASDTSGVSGTPGAPSAPSVRDHRFMLPRVGAAAAAQPSPDLGSSGPDMSAAVKSIRPSTLPVRAGNAVSASSSEPSIFSRARSATVTIGGSPPHPVLGSALEGNTTWSQPHGQTTASTPVLAQEQDSSSNSASAKGSHTSSSKGSKGALQASLSAVRSISSVRQYALTPPSITGIDPDPYHKGMDELSLGAGTDTEADEEAAVRTPTSLAGNGAVCAALASPGADSASTRSSSRLQQRFRRGTHTNQSDSAGVTPAGQESPTPSTMVLERRVPVAFADEVTHESEGIGRVSMDGTDPKGEKEETESPAPSHHHHVFRVPSAATLTHRAPTNTKRLTAQPTAQPIAPSGTQDVPKNSSPNRADAELPPGTEQPLAPPIDKPHVAPPPPSSEPERHVSHQMSRTNIHLMHGPPARTQRPSYTPDQNHNQNHNQNHGPSHKPSFPRVKSHLGKDTLFHPSAHRSPAPARKQALTNENDQNCVIM